MSTNIPPIASVVIPTVKVDVLVARKTHLEGVPVNPLIAAAVAAYRIGETIASASSDAALPTAAEGVPEVTAIPRIAPIQLNLHNGNSEGGHNGVMTVPQKAEFKMAYAQLATQSYVNFLG